MFVLRDTSCPWWFMILDTAREYEQCRTAAIRSIIANAC
jgi:hypothetical protein